MTFLSRKSWQLQLTLEWKVHIQKQKSSNIGACSHLYEYKCTCTCTFLGKKMAELALDQDTLTGYFPGQIPGQCSDFTRRICLF